MLSLSSKKSMICVIKVFIPTWVMINLEFMFIRDGNTVLMSLTVISWRPVMAPSYIATCQHDLLPRFQGSVGLCCISIWSFFFF